MTYFNRFYTVNFTTLVPSLAVTVRMKCNGSLICWVKIAADHPCLLSVCKDDTIAEFVSNGLDPEKDYGSANVVC